MCGIAGIYNIDGTPVNPADLAKMADAIRRRGPDDSGWVLVRSDGKAPPLRDDQPASQSRHDVGLVNRRLAIIDLTATGHQPMSADDCHLVFNGEIYNYIELRDELGRMGHRFASHSDTEVLLRAYLQWGVGFLERLNGIFAFAIWDGRQKRLVLARDRLGVKPLYYRHEGSRLMFASEIRGIRTVTARPAELNEPLVAAFLSVGWLDHTDETFHKDVFKLPAGTYAIITPAAMIINRYWDYEPSVSFTGSFREAVDAFGVLFEDAVRLQMRSDVAVGSCLSGGMDSSSIVCLAAPMSRFAMRTFTARFHQAEMDESQYSQAVVRHAATGSIEEFVTPDAFVRDLPAVIDAQEEPFDGPSVYAQWALMRKIQEQGIKVVLDGQGGDELLCGYAKYGYYALFDKLRAGRVFSSTLSAVQLISRGGRHFFNLTGARRYLPSLVRRDVGHTLLPEYLRYSSGRNASRPHGDVRSQQVMDVATYSLPVLLRYEDKNSMYHSVEARVPFLDHRLVEFCLSLPTEYKIEGGLAKLVLRRALGTRLPREVLERRNKLGFGGTFASWVRLLGPILTEWASRDHLAIDKYVHRDALHDMIEKSDPAVFRPYVLDRWLMQNGFG